MRTALLLVVLCACSKKPGASDAGVLRPPPDWLAGRPVLMPGAPKAGGTLIIRLPIEPVGLTRFHNQFSEGTMVRATVGPLYETLASARDGQLRPLLASSWVESDDHLTLTVSLRADVLFHDGTAMSAGDVKATIDVIMNPKNATSTFRSSFEVLERVEVVDARTVVIKWKRPYFLSTWTVLSRLPILPAHALQGDFDTLAIHRAPIGTGPFRFEAWNVGTSLSMVRNAKYWGKAAYLDKVIYRFVKDDTVAVTAWERGEFDVMTRIPPSAWRASESNPALWAQYQRVLFVENTYGWLGFNQRKDIFKDAKVRRALGLLFPSALVEKTVELGLEPRTTCPYFPSSESCDPDVKPLPFQRLEAEKLLTEAGWTDSDGDGLLDRHAVPLRFSFLAPAQSQKLGQVLPLYLDVLKQVGIEAHIETVDISAYMSRVRAHDFDAMALSWNSPEAVQDNFQNFHSSQAAEGANYVGYSNAQVDALLVAIRGEYDASKRVELERRVHRLVYEDQAYLFLTRKPALDAFKIKVRGLVPNLGWYDLSAVWISD